MSESLDDVTRDAALLSAALKSLRKHRGMSAAEVASAMNMAVRTYERFEAGDTRLNLDHIHRFARATRTDPHAILMSVLIGSPAFARRSADNRLATIIIICLQKFDELAGERLATLDTRTLIAAVTGMFDALAAHHLPDDDVAAWLQQGTEDLNAKRPKPGR